MSNRPDMMSKTLLTSRAFLKILLLLLSYPSFGHLLVWSASSPATTNEVFLDTELETFPPKEIIFLCHLARHGGQCPVNTNVSPDSL